MRLLTVVRPQNIEAWVGFIAARVWRPAGRLRSFFILRPNFHDHVGTTARRSPGIFSRKDEQFTPATALIGEVILFLAVLGAVRWFAHGAAASWTNNLRAAAPCSLFWRNVRLAALSALVGALVWGWLLSVRALSVRDIRLCRNLGRRFSAYRHR